MNSVDLTQQASWIQAQAGDLGAIAHLLNTTIGDRQVRVEVSRRDRTLYVFLTTVQSPQLNSYLHRIHATVNALRLETITQLKVLDGTEKRLLNRWQYDFSLDPLRLTAPSSPAALPDAAEADISDPERPVSLPVSSVVAPLVDLSIRNKSFVKSTFCRLGILPDRGQPRRLSHVIKSLILSAPQPRDRRWRQVVLPTAIALGFGLSAGITQWRYKQRAANQSEPVAISAVEAAAALATPIQPLIAAERTATLAPPALVVPVTLTIKAVGDIIPGTDYQRYRLPDDWQYLFGGIQYHLGDADITFGNFESTLTEVPHSAKNTASANTFAFRTPPWYASVLGAAGFDVLSVANNHSMDFFEQGFADTIAHIEAAGMKAVGRKGEVVVVEAQGQRVAFIGFSNYPEHNRVQDLESAIALVQAAQQQADIVVVSFHAGKEGTDATVTRDQDELFYSENRGNVVRFSRTVVDHGADLVLGHGPHVPRAIELYNGKLIAYSLGNFLGYRSLSTVGPLGTSLILQTNLDARGNFVSGRIIPVALDRNGVPYLDDHFGGVVLVRQFTQRDFPDTPLAIDDLGYIWPQ